MAAPHLGISQDLREHQWKNRLVLLFDETTSSKAIQKELELFIDNAQALRERDLLLFQITPNQVYDIDTKVTQLKASEVYRRFNIAAEFKGVVLIGKDGGSKLQQPYHVKPQTIFTLIDGMPMRKREMRNSGKK